MQKEEILRLIKETIAKTIPSGAKVILFGSQARGDAREDSDWDILILLNKDKVELDDHDYISYPFFELGWNIDVQIHPILYTFKDWMERSFSPFYKNVERHEELHKRTDALAAEMGMQINVTRQEVFDAMHTI